jgi:hypothetical protein
MIRESFIIPAVCSLQKHCHILFHDRYLESKRSQTILLWQFSLSEFFSLLRYSEDVLLLGRKLPYDLQ